MKWKSVMLAFLLFGVGFLSGYGLYGYMGDSSGGENSIDVIGSTTVFPVTIDAANEYMQEYEDVIVNVKGGGSGHGYSTVSSGKANIGMHSRKPAAQEIQDAKAGNVNLTLYSIGIDALASIVNPSVVPEDKETIMLTRRQIGQIYNQTVPDEEYQIKTWGDVETHLGVNVADNSHNHDIMVFDREAGSGTRGVFLERCLEPYGYEMNPDTGGVGSNKAMRQNVKDTKGSIGYIGLGYLTADVKAVTINETGTLFLPTELESGGTDDKNLTAYPLSRELYMSTDGYIFENDPKALTARFLKFVMSPRGSQIVKKNDYFALKEKMRVYRWSTVQNWM